METGHPSTRAVSSGSGNRALLHYTDSLPDMWHHQANQIIILIVFFYIFLKTNCRFCQIRNGWTSSSYEARHIQSFRFRPFVGPEKFSAVKWQTSTQLAQSDVSHHSLSQRITKTPDSCHTYMIHTLPTTRTHAHKGAPISQKKNSQDELSHIIQAVKLRQ